MDTWVYPKKSLSRRAGEHFRKSVTRPVVAHVYRSSVCMLEKVCGVNVGTVNHVVMKHSGL